MKTESDKIYEDMITLLEHIKSNKKLSDFSFDSRFQYSYLSALVNKNIREDGRVRKWSPDTNRLIVKSAKRFIKKENI